eukprot:scaffold46532_cov17-Tisochrysis_lutea.AAC.2
MTEKDGHAQRGCCDFTGLLLWRVKAMLAGSLAPDMNPRRVSPPPLCSPTSQTCRTEPLSVPWHPPDLLIPEGAKTGKASMTCWLLRAVCSSPPQKEPSSDGNSMKFCNQAHSEDSAAFVSHSTKFAPPVIRLLLLTGVPNKASLTLKTCLISARKQHLDEGPCLTVIMEPCAFLEHRSLDLVACFLIQMGNMLLDAVTEEA